MGYKISAVSRVVGKFPLLQTECTSSSAYQVFCQDAIFVWFQPPPDNSLLLPFPIDSHQKSQLPMTFPVEIPPPWPEALPGRLLRDVGHRPRLDHGGRAAGGAAGALGAGWRQSARGDLGDFGHEKWGFATKNPKGTLMDLDVS